MSNYEFDVLIHGKSTLKYVHEGRIYLEGRAGSEFTLLVKNNTATRVLAVMTVDGLSVMDGKAGSVDGSGYIVPAFGTIKVPGWRLDNDDVAKFKFGTKGKSYAAQKGNARNVGVIGCAIFEERDPVYTFTVSNYPYHNILRGVDGGHFTYNSCDSDLLYSDSETTVSSQDACRVTSTSCNSLRSGEEHTSGGIKPQAVRRMAVQNVQNIGTEFGNRTAHAVTEVEFQKKDRPTETFAVYYDDRAGLKARGIDLDRKIMIANPFPKDAEGGCIPPTGWSG